MTDAEIIELVLRHEGVWDDHPADSGGRTAYGISSRYHPEAWVNGPPTREQAIAIYQRDYVAPFAAVEPELKPQVVDIAVLSGVTTARALYAVAKANHGSRSVNTQLVVERLKHLARIVKAKPTQSVFLLGWINRAVSFLSVLLVFAGAAAAQPPAESSLGTRPVPRIVGMSGSDEGRTYHKVPLDQIKTTKWTHVESCGVVTLVKHEADGDTHIRLDAGGAFIVVETVPYHPLAKPKVGQTIRVRGISRLDRTHSWYELHPLEEWSAVARCPK